MTIWEATLNGDGSSGGEYTGTAEINIGNISAGQVFTASSMQAMWDNLIKQEQFPTLTNPSNSFTSSITGFREVGEVVSIIFNSTFNKGDISPQYTSLSSYRSGDPNAYQFTGTGLADQVKSSLSDSQTVSGYTVIINGQSWQGRIAYDEGVQPKSSYDNDFNSPLPPGTTSYITRSITGVYPSYATTSSIDTLTKQGLTSHSSEYIQIDVVAESGLDKQTFDFPDVWSNITGIQQYNTLNLTWEWIGGSKANSLLTFDVTTTNHNIQGNIINYNKYTNNGSLIGSRQLRWYTT